MTEMVKSLPYKHEFRSPNTHVHSWAQKSMNRSTWEWGGEDRQIPEIPWPVTLAKTESSKFSERPCLKIRWKAIEEDN